MRTHFRLGLAVIVALGGASFACSSSDGTEPANQPPADVPDAASPDAPSNEDAPAADAEPGPIQFNDVNLESCVRTALAMPEGDLYPEHLATLTHLACQDMQIANIAGLEYATSLVELSLWENQIVDLTPLAQLAQLQDAQLGFNQIADITPLSGLTALTRLGLAQNQIGGLEPLAGLTELTWLNLDNNTIGDAELVHLAGLSKLRWLTLEHNGIKDFSAIQGLIDGGCDLYGNAVVAKGLTKSPLASKLGAADTRPGTLRVSVGANGKVHLTYQIGKESLPVRRVFSGSLFAEGGHITYRVGDRNVQVGTVGSSGPVLCAGDYANVCDLRVGRKDGSTGSRPAGMTTEPIITARISLRDNGPKSKVLGAEDWTLSDETLEQYALASPNQLDAGSCLQMANSGAMEILMNQHTPAEEIAYDGDTDLSERYLMTAGDYVPSSDMPYYLTDQAYIYNSLGGSLLSRDYPFCVGWCKDTASGGVALASSTDPDKYPSAYANWFDQMPSNWRDLLVPTPPVERTLIFVDPKRDEDSYWRVALFNDETIAQIKHELRTKRAPVVVVHNYYLWWHTSVIVGYDDTLNSDGCADMADRIAYFKQKGFTSYATAVEKHMDENGGCSDTGVFFVRDSIYDGGIEEPMYDYSTDQVSIQKEKYSKRIVPLPYDWAKYMGNHAYTMQRQ